MTWKAHARRSILKAILLDGSQADDNTGERVCTALMGQLEAQGWGVEQIVLREKKLGPCAGDFFCWVRSPGVCNVDGDNRAIAAAIVASDLLVYLTPVTFGRYSSALKRMVDHQIQNISPFFAKVEGETHHHKRYRKNPDFLAVGWTDGRHEGTEAIFRHLVQRNALNFCAQNHVGGLAFPGQTDAELLASAEGWLDELRNGQRAQRVELPASGLSVNGASPIRRALLLVGSPKAGKSNSNSLGAYLFEQLGERCIETETIYLHGVLRSPVKMQALLDALGAADLVTLAFPVYVDSLPAPVTEALERIAAYRQECNGSRQPLPTAIANCGFPEAEHGSAALAICETFARKAGFAWAGALALGAGQMLNGTPLAELGGMTIRIRQSLDLAVDALAQGQPIPEAARDMMARPVVPHWAYRLMGGVGWIRAARGYGVSRMLWRRPYLARPLTS